MSNMVNVNSLEAEFYPLTLTRSFREIKIGRFSFEDRWKIILAKTDPPKISIPYSYFPTVKLLHYISKNKQLPVRLRSYCLVLTNITDIVKHVDQFIETDILLAAAKKLAPIPETVKCTNKENIFIEAGANLRHCYINAENGPVYIAKNVRIQDGVCINGPVYIGTGSVIKMGATLYGATVIGDHCLAGGEIKNSILMDYTNKAHFGYLGDSIIGEWCNLGAGTSNSNIKNNASPVQIQLVHKKINAGLKFGMLMGDFSKSAILTAFNTGTVVGTCANVFSNGLTPKFIPSFSWGNTGEKYSFEKAIQDIEKWMAFKDKKIKKEIKKKLKIVFDKE